MFEASLYPKTKQVLEKLVKLEVINNFYLAGGTALALQLGHRKSIDLDFFTPKFPSKNLLLKQLSVLNPKVIQEAEGTLDVIIDTVKVSFLKYQYGMIQEFTRYNNLNMASVLDIGCMKLTAISSRGSKKDFVDLYFIMKKYSLQSLLDAVASKFSDVDYSMMHILKSLSYFEDAQNDPDPDFLVKTNWESVKNKILDETLKLQI